MKLVWAYHDGFNTGPTNSTIPPEFIRYLFKESIIKAPNSYIKVIYTQEQYVDYFKNIVDRVEIFKDLEYTFLNDAKWYAIEKEENAIIIDGDLFLEEELYIPEEYKVGFEFTISSAENVSRYSSIFEKNGIKEYIPYWKRGCNSINTGLMYINDVNVKKNILKQYRLVRKFFKDKFNTNSSLLDRNKQPSVVGSQYFLTLFLENYKVDYFNFNKHSKFTHYFGEKKLKLLSDFYKNNLTSVI